MVKRAYTVGATPATTSWCSGTCVVAFSSCSFFFYTLLYDFVSSFTFFTSLFSFHALRFLTLTMYCVVGVVRCSNYCWLWLKIAGYCWQRWRFCYNCETCVWRYWNDNLVSFFAGFLWSCCWRRNGFAGLSFNGALRTISRWKSWQWILDLWVSKCLRGTRFSCRMLLSLFLFWILFLLCQWLLLVAAQTKA